MTHLGIDIGSVTAKLALLDDERVVDARVLRTQGRPADALRRLLAEALARHGDLELTVMATGSGKSLVPDPAGRVSEIVAHARAAARFHPQVRAVLEIGGQDAKMIWLPGTGEPRILDHALNDLCAAGTGAFLDQQAARLGLSAEELGRLAASSTSPAAVAGRCAVFAKTDMIHLQQRGVPTADICAGVCHALVRNVVATLARGRDVPAPLLLQGGVALSAGVRLAVPAVTGLSPEQVELPERPVAMGAVGAALLAARHGGRTTLARLLAAVADEPTVQEAPAPVLTRPPAAPRTGSRRTRPTSGPLRLGIDVGSASTKAVLLDPADRVVGSAYLPTQGRPLRAVREVLEELVRQRPAAEVAGLCTTGSGRHLVALWLQADATIDEITAQARGSVAACGDDVTGVIEIGGQDAKAIALCDGRVARFAMNRLCAAGTGSFLEEQAARLDTAVGDFAEQAFASTAPARLAGKCAVFMDADLVHHQQHGAARADLLAGLAHAVVENYLRRVKGPLELGDRPVLQGGVAANAAVVAAFAGALGHPVRVHPHATVSGALGAALSVPAGNARRSLAKLAAMDEPPTRATTCKQCDNRCELTLLRTGDGASVTLGGACGRYDRARLVPGARAREDAAAELEAERERLWAGPPRPADRPAPRGRIGIPRAILAHDLYPHFRTFLGALGWEPVPSGPSRRSTLLRAAHALTAEPCLPAKLLLGHVGELADEGLPAVFLPTPLSMPEADEPIARSEPTRVIYRYPCMYGLTAGDLACAASLVDEPDHHRGRADATPSTVERHLRRLLGDHQPLPDRATTLRRGGGGPRLLAPELMLDWRGALFRPLLTQFADHEGLDPAATIRAARDALDAYHAYRRELRALGRRYLERHPGIPVAVVLGHPYVVHDAYLNLQLMRRLARVGFLPLPFDLVPEAPALGPSWDQVGWRSNRDLLRAATWTAARDDAFPVVVTCFGCGPDAFVVRFLEEALGDRPHLTLEFDEHQAEAGLETRLEAFHHAVEEIRQGRRTARVEAAEPRPERATPDAARSSTAAGSTLERWAPRTTGRLDALRNRTIVVSRFGDSAPVFRGYFQARGFDARLGPEIDETSLALGRAFSGGQECNPFTYFTGDMVRILQEPGADPSRLAFYVPSSDGACLVSQYGRGFESAARRLGAEDLVIFNPFFGELTDAAGIRLLSRLWQALTGSEALTQLAAELRPFELEPGAVDRARRRAGERLGDAMAHGNVRRAVEESVDLFAAIPRRPWEPRPAIGLVGDIFTRGNDASNRHLVRTIEQAGCRALIPPTLTDIAAFVTGEWVHKAGQAGEFNSVLRGALQETWQRVVGIWTTAPLHRLTRPPRLERTYRDVIALSRPYFGRPVEAMLTLNISKAVEQLEAGALGVLNVVCHGCMVGILSESAFRPMREAYPGRPILTLTYDGLGDTHVATRVEAFLQRVLEQQEAAR